MRLARIRHVCGRGTLLLLSAAPVLTAPARGQSTLFDSHEPLELRITADFRALMAERDSLKLQAFPATLGYLGPSGEPVAVEAKLKLRGHWRRQKRNCSFAPIKVDLSKDARQGTIFDGLGDLKLVVHCRDNDKYRQYVLREYAVYRLYNALTPLSHRVRLVRAHYLDTSAQGDTVTAPAYFLENDRRMAERNGAQPMQATGARWEHMDDDQGALVSAFEYMIGGSDWSLPGLHNVLLLQHPEMGGIIPVVYDFDWTGIVHTDYAKPDYRLPIRSVRERVYRGMCRSPEQWAPVLDRFRAARAALYAVYDSVPGLDPDYVRDTRRYLDGFFEVVDDPSRLQREMIQPCRE